MASVTDPGGFVIASGIPIPVLLARYEKHSCPEALTGCRLWTASLMPQGYGRWNVGQVIRCSHRVAWELFVGAIPDGMHVLHRCDTRACVNADHLFLGTNLDNIRDRVSKLRSPHGSSHYRAKLTERAVKEILLAPGTQRQIASRYGVGQATIADIRAGRTWSHLRRGTRKETECRDEPSNSIAATASSLQLDATSPSCSVRSTDGV